MSESVLQKLQKEIESRPKPLHKTYHKIYDIIEKQDKLIKNKQNTIKQIKQNTMSEFIYSNSQIPTQWKNKIDFQDNITKLLVENQDLLFYLGHDVRQDENENDQGLTITINSRSYRKNFHPKSARISNMTNIKKLKKANSCKNNLKNIKRNRFSSLDSPIFSTPPNKTNNNLKKNKIKYTKEEIIDIFDEMKNEFPIRNKFAEFYPNFEEDLKKHKRILQQDVNEENNKKNKKIKNNFLINNQKYSMQKKKYIFGNNIYNNLISIQSGNDKNKINEKFAQPFICNKKFHKNKNYTPRINSADNKIDYNIIKIENPAVFKLLKGVNFYGPYYSYCVPCADKNIGYYKRLGKNQCINILKSFKKEKLTI